MTISFHILVILQEKYIFCESNEISDLWKKCVPVTFSVLRMVRKSTFVVLLACPSDNIFSYCGNRAGKISFFVNQMRFLNYEKMCPRDIFSFKNGQKINFLVLLACPSGNIFSYFGNLAGKNIFFVNQMRFLNYEKNVSPWHFQF